MIVWLGILLTGCGSKKSGLSEDEKYPVRADWLVKNVPSSSGQPSKWYEPGYPPLAMLNRPFDTLAGDDALLVTQVRNKVILNTRKIDEEVRDAFGKVLTELFGTPIEPRVPSAETLIETLKWNDKLAESRQAFQAQRTALDQVRQSAKTAEEREAFAPLEKASLALAAEVTRWEEKIESLGNYEAELKLDPKTLKAGSLVYGNYCLQCHGLTGDGNGPGGKYLIPMPRDYRQGLFKFITSDPSLGSKRKPLRSDLYRTIAKGLDGSPMPQFAGLKEEEIQAVISYVIHLSMRGEAEYEVMKTAADPGGDEMSKEDVRKAIFKEAGETPSRWVASAHNPIVPDPNPYVTESQIQRSAENGYKLFTSAEVGCQTCHTNYGRGAPYQFDSWGSIVRPRNLTVATLRGGRSPEAIYARLYGGILGSNMPAHAHLRPTPEERLKNTDKLWDLVHFVQYVSESENRQVLKDQFQIEIDP